MQTFRAGGPLTGTIRVPGDKSISHRALMLSALAIGRSQIAGLLEGEDVLSTAAALHAMGADIRRHDDATWVVHGVGTGGLTQPGKALDMGNSGTSARLLMGLLASHDVIVSMTGDASLSSRPMARVTDPLGKTGAEFTTSPGGTLPLMLRGMTPAVPIEYRLPVASAQVKSAILLAGLNTSGITRVVEPIPTRDHSERMLKGFGADIDVETDTNGVRTISLHGPAELQPQHITVPGDPSSAAFFMVAALIVPESDLIIENVGINATRAGLIGLLQQMGGQIELQNEREIGGEPVADLHVRHSPLKGVAVDPAIAPSMIDEFPVFFIAAAMADGQTVTSGLEELRVKESDRLAMMAKGLQQTGVELQENEDGLVIEGRSGKPFISRLESSIHSALDHRIAMSFAVAGLASENGVTIDDVSPIATSFPNFETLIEQTQG
ncbi:3-phosphoshikimate 1-carboxyvinyltransferase [Sphingorhabdus sp. Alg239-R122]|uniref:3-phosphoshikimate 1-carboxyvinyltransferase n=1 Tax=Sphingorhabdus sp. Alg239-R122 TaxID=2305989 RepID=UPI001F0826F7|nr:3-phosphoshikimate 1-carboxyvinyltransferase [Sphingorhabdus sp. Alg239-R122]